MIHYQLLKTLSFQPFLESDFCAFQVFNLRLYTRDPYAAF